jgi:opacity protein-like surface antigen
MPGEAEEVRTRERLIRFCCLPIFLALFSSPVFSAQKHKLRISLFGGASFLKAQRIFLVGGQAFRSEFSDGGKAGVRVDINLSRRWALEGGYGYGSSNLRLLKFGGAERGFGMRLEQLEGNLLGYLNDERQAFRPFVTLGLGWARYSPTSEAKEAAATMGFTSGPAALSSSNNLDFNFGAGLEGKLAGPLRFRIEFRDHVSRVPRFGLPRESFPVAGAAEDLEASLGVVFSIPH